MESHSLKVQSESKQSLREALGQNITLVELRVPTSDFSSCPLVDMPAEGSDRVDAPETSTLSENVFPEVSLTAASFASVAQADIIPRMLDCKPLAVGGFFIVVART